MHVTTPLPHDSDPAQAWQQQPREAFQQWLASQPRRTEYAQHSVEQYVAMVGAVADWWRTERGVTLIDAQAADLEAFLASLPGRSGKGAAPTTVRRYLNRLDSLFVHLIEQGLRHSNPAVQLMRLQQYTGQERAAPRALTLKQSETYIDFVLAQPTRHWVDLRNKALQALFLATGLTVEEVQRLELSDFQLDDLVPGIKVRAHGPIPSRRVPVPTWAIASITAWLTRRALFHLGEGDGTQLLFITRRRAPQVAEDDSDPVPLPLSDSEIYEVVRPAVEASGYQDEQMGPQTLRNTFAIRQMHAGTSDDQLKRWLGLKTAFTLTALRRQMPLLQG